MNIHLTTQQPCKIVTINVHILKMGKPKLIEVRNLPKGKSLVGVV